MHREIAMKKLVVSTCLACALVAATSLAADSVDQARTLFNAGAQAYEAGQFVAAAQAFEQAYNLSPRAGILFSMAQAWKRQYFIDRNPANLQRAVKLYRDYLGKVEQGGRRSDAAQALAELEPLAARTSSEPSAAPPPPAAPQTRVMVSSQNEGARVSLDGAAEVAAPLIVEVKPGQHTVRVVAPGHFPEERKVAAAEGAVLALDLALREKPARLSFVGSAGAEVSVDGRLLGRTPFTAPVEIEPGLHLIVVARNGHRPHVQELEVSRDEAKEVRYSLPGTGQRTVSWGMFATAGAGLVAGGVFTGLALREQNKAQDVLDTRAQQQLSPSDADTFDDATKSRDRWRTAAIASFGGAAALGITGLLLYAFDQPSVAAQPSRFERRSTPAPRPREPGAMEISAAPVIVPGVAGLQMVGSF